ncbi:hypothetical protein L6164_018027 [Bauhinia variegata]|uniref:Uncharacterized protein n=1 Tax=Bauhinia variegata TaxID=167791 RepID=A0ACB9NBM1_BAUVA|nr:hypothetical protein L6164_018027 [Bauhinia variegata]
MRSQRRLSLQLIEEAPMADAIMLHGGIFILCATKKGISSNDIVGHGQSHSPPPSSPINKTDVKTTSSGDRSSLINRGCVRIVILRELFD